MNPITRSELQSREAKVKRAEILGTIKVIHDNVNIYANRGFKELYVEIIDSSIINQSILIGKIDRQDEKLNCIKLYITNIQETLEVLKEYFPDSKLEFKETWVDINSTIRMLKRVILVDWS